MNALVKQLLAPAPSNDTPVSLDHATTGRQQNITNITGLVSTAAIPPLDQISRPTLPTSLAAIYLNRMPQTLRAWACLENGPIRPIRINGRLAWPVSEVRKLLNGGRDEQS